MYFILRFNKINKTKQKPNRNLIRKYFYSIISSYKRTHKYVFKKIKNEKKKWKKFILYKSTLI